MSAPAYTLLQAVARAVEAALTASRDDYALAPPPACQWCGHPITGPVAWWDDRPQCPNPHTCARRTKERR
ncbi:hypothetical protein ABT282_15855 [Streptomyces sp. NPDC000927]|uniref:hypothetical protein n=1 Tax=Streptomyces sp. NPDC000927 TaxID=3154371 RepID=UPI00332183EB